MTIELGVLLSVLSIIIAFLGYQLNKQKQQMNEQRYQLDQHKEIKSDSQESAEVKAELGYIRKGVDDIRIDFRANEKNVAHLSERVTRVEESSKQAHKRIDNVESPEKK